MDKIVKTAGFRSEMYAALAGINVYIDGVFYYCKTMYGKNGQDSKVTYISVFGISQEDGYTEDELKEEVKNRRKEGIEIAGIFNATTEQSDDKEELIKIINDSETKICFNGIECKKLDLSEFNSDKLDNVKNMFFGCKIDNLDFSLEPRKFNVVSMVNLSKMFAGSCIKKLKLKGLNVSKCTNMSYMFEDCMFDNIDFQDFNTYNVENMKGMFQGAKSIGRKFMNKGVNTDYKVPNTGLGYSSTKLDLSGFDMSNVANMSEMFEKCELEKVNMRCGRIPKVTDMSGIFREANIEELDLISVFIDMSGITTSNIEDYIADMFSGANITTLFLVGVVIKTGNKIFKAGEIYNIIKDVCNIKNCIFLS